MTAPVSSAPPVAHAAVHAPARVLLIADTMPGKISGLAALLARADFRFIIAPLKDAVGIIGEQDLAATIVLASPGYFSNRQKELIHVLDELTARHIGAVLLTCSDDDLALAQRMTEADGLLAARHTIPGEELAGIIAGITTVRPIIDSLQRENAMLRRYDSGLNSQMTQLDEEMRLAARLQVDFLPRQLPQIGDLSFNVFFRPASYVSGDIYDVQRLDEEHIGFFIADAVGHGMPAALLTIFIKRTLVTKEIANNQYRIVPPDEALARLNNELLTQQLSLCQFVTMIYGIINTRTLELQFARAGHPLPMLLKTTGNASELDVDGALLGVFPDEKFPLSKVQLEPGDSLLLYSDGFESAFHDPAGVVNERYRLEFARLAGPHPATRFAEMIAMLDSQEGSLHQRDDLTALMLTIADTRC